MQKDASYHKAAIKYNEELAVFAANLSKEVEHEEVSKWCMSVSRQHEFHAGRHQKALDKLENKKQKLEKKPEEEEAPKPAEPVEDAPDPKKAAEPVEEKQGASA